MIWYTMKIAELMALNNIIKVSLMVKKYSPPNSINTPIC